MSSGSKVVNHVALVYGKSDVSTEEVSKTSLQDNTDTSNMLRSFSGYNYDISGHSSEELSELLSRIQGIYSVNTNRVKKLERIKDRTVTQQEELEKAMEHMDFQLQDMMTIQRVRKLTIFPYCTRLAKKSVPPLSEVRPTQSESPVMDSAVTDQIAPSIERMEHESASSGKRRLSVDSDSQNLNNNSEDFTLVSHKKVKQISKKSEDDLTIVKEKKTRVPPIKIVPPDNWQVLLGSIKRVAKSAHSKMVGRFLSIKCENVDDYRATQKHLREMQIQFQSYALEEEKPIRVVLRGLPINTDVKLIQNSLEEIYDFEDITVTQMYRGPVSNKKYIPLFYISIPKKNNFDSIFQITELLETEVSFEVYRGKKGPSQCHNCQGFFHTSFACHLPPPGA